MNSADDYELDVYHFSTGEEFQPETFGFPFSVGDGFVVEGGSRRLIVTAIWYSADKRGALGWGRHVFFDDVTNTDADLPLQVAPQYYS